MLPLQGSGGVHEDEVMGVGLDASLAAEEAAEQAVLTQLHNRAACLENDLLRQALDGLPPHSKVLCNLCDPLCNSYTAFVT